MIEAAGVPPPKPAGGPWCWAVRARESPSSRRLCRGALRRKPAVGEPAVTYVATSTVGGDDPDWQRRIAAHRAVAPRPGGRSRPSDLAAALRDAEGTLVVDSLTAWLTGVIEPGGRLGRPGRDDRGRIAPRRGPGAGVARHQGAGGCVSDEVGLGVVPATPSGRLFRDELGALNQRMAAAADSVWLVVAGIPMRLR